MPKKHILVQSKENTDINKMCKNASQKVNAIARISGIKKVKIIMKIFIILQFGYCPLIWMFHRRHLSNKIHFFHERTLRIIYLYDDKESTF